MNIFDTKKLSTDIIAKRSGITFRVAAKEAKISAATLCRIEGKYLPDVETLGKLCKWMGYSPERYFKL